MEKIRAKRPWAPSPYRPPMMGIFRPTFHAQMGIAPIVGVAVKWGLPWLLAAGGIAATTFVMKEIFPEVPINKEKIGLAALLGGGGVTSYLVSDVIPEGWRPVTYAIAVAGVSSALYFLFSPVAQKISEANTGIPSDRPPPGEAVEETRAGHLEEMIEIITPSAPEQPGGKWRTMFLPQTYRFLLRNITPGRVTFYAGLSIYDASRAITEGERIYKTPVIKSPPYGRVEVRLDPTPREESKWLDLQTPAVTPSIFATPIIVELELFRNFRDTEPFMRSAPLDIVLSPVAV